MCDFYVPTPKDSLVGKGGYGSIYNTPGKECVVKVSHNALPCRGIRHEFEVTKRLAAAFDETLTSSEKAFVGIVRPSRFGECHRRCCFSMQYLKPLSARDKFVTQAYLALPTYSKTLVNKNEARGVYRGAAELGRCLSRFDLTALEVAYYVGVAMAAMHYGAELTGVDTEVVVAFAGTQMTRPKVFIIDHDRNGPLDLSKKQATVSILASLLGSGEPYYPMHGKLGEAFRTGYLKKAADLGYLELAGDVLAMSVLESIEVPPLPL